MSVSRTLAVLAMLAAILGAWFFATSAASQAASVYPTIQPPASSEPVELLKSDAAGITFAVQVAGLVLEQNLVNGTMYDTVSVPGFAASTKTGSPQVPTRRLLLGIPLDAEYHLHITAGQSETVSDRFKLLPAPTPILEPASESELQLDPRVSVPGVAGWDYVEDERAYSTNALYPDALAKIVSTGFIRDQRFIAVQVNPVQYNPVTGELVLHSQVTVEINFTYPRGRALGASRSDASFEPVLRAGILNYESAADWRGMPSGTTIPTVNPAAAIRDASSPALKIMVDEDGIYQITAADLEALDVPTSTLPTTAYKLFYRGREVPIRVLKSETGNLESLWFFGEQARTKYTNTNVYWLTYEPTPDPGLRMPLRDAPPVPPETVGVSLSYSTTVRLEEDHWYRSYMPWAGNLDLDPWDHWFWTTTVYIKDDPDPPESLVVPVQLSGLDTELYSATLRASVTGWTGELKPDYGHCVEFHVNDQRVGDHTWIGKYQEQLVGFAFSSSELHEGTNAVEVHGCESEAYSDRVFYDWFELDLRRLYHVEEDWLVFDVAEGDWQYEVDGFTNDAIEVFDVSGTYTVSQLVGYSVSPLAPYSVSFYDSAAQQGTRYLALTRDQLKSPVEIVKDTPSDLANTANRADYIIIAPQEFITDVQPLADHRAAHGLAVEVVDLESIYDEFNYGVYSPEAIRNFLDYAYHNWSGVAPAYVLLVGDGTYDYKNNLNGNPNLLPPYLAWVDPWFGEEAADNRYVTVAGDDPFPDMHIGRFPAETSEHVQIMVEKTLAYESDPETPEWTRRLLFVADNPDDAGDFHSLSDDLVDNYLPDPYVPTKAYYGSTCLTGAECTEVILDTLNIGALLVNYIGHGGVTNWTNNGVWDIDDLASLNATFGLPVVLSMTCFDGAFHQDKGISFQGTVLAEATVRLAADRGAVASWSPTGAGVASGHDYLNKGFLQATLYNGVRQLGAAADAGKARLFATGHYTDLLETYHLFGDPALRINSNDVVDVSVGQSIVESPSENKIEITLSFTNAGPDVAVGVALTDVIPTGLINPTVVSASPEVLASREGITFAWTIADLPSGVSGEIVLEAGTVADEEISFFNVAQIDVETHDLVPGNNVSWAGLNLKTVYLPLIMKGF